MPKAPEDHSKRIEVLVAGYEAAKKIGGIDGLIDNETDRQWFHDLENAIDNNTLTGFVNTMIRKPGFTDLMKNMREIRELARDVVVPRSESPEEVLASA